MSSEQSQRSRRTRRVVKRKRVRRPASAQRAPAPAGGPPVMEPMEGHGGAVQIKRPKQYYPSEQAGDVTSGYDAGKSREEKLKDDYLDIAQRYEDQMLYDDALKFYRKAGSMPDVARVKERMEGLYEKKAEEFKSRGKYAEAFRLYNKLGNTPEADRMKALARERGEFLLEDVEKMDLAGGDCGPDGEEGGAHGGPAPPDDDPDGREDPSTGDASGASGLRDITGMAGNGEGPGGREFVTEEGVRVLEVKRGRSVSDTREAGAGDAERHFSFCPYCGERISLPKPPAFCPFCGDRF